MELVVPNDDYVGGYVDALKRRWSPNTMRPEAADEELAVVEQDKAAFLQSMIDREASGPPIVLPDGALAPRLPGIRLWMWDGEFCGSIGFRWQPGTSALPDHVLGHIGYSVVPWKQGRGYAKAALGLILLEAVAEGLDHVDLTTDTDNIASQRVIEANGGVRLERFRPTAAYGEAMMYRYRIELNRSR